MAQNTIIDNDLKLEQDRASIHTAKLTQEAFDVMGIDTILWPSHGADLSCVEQMWAEMKKRIPYKKYASRDEFKESIKRAWDDIPEQTVMNLIKSMPGRMKKCIEMKGGWIGY